MKNYVILLAGGVGKRMGTDIPKQFLEVNGSCSTKLLGKVESFLLAVYCNDVFNTHCTKYCYTDKTDRSASLNCNTGIES